MAKKLVKLTSLDIILQADADTIREAYESRVKIDDLLVKREEAYRQIEAIELQVEELVGKEGEFVYPGPPVAVAGFSNPSPVSRPKPKIVKPKPEKDPASEKPAPTEQEEPNETASKESEKVEPTESKTATSGAAE